LWYNKGTNKEEEKMKEKYIDYLFEDEDTGELFFVEIKKTENMSYTDCFNKAWEIAEENFDSPMFVEEVDPAVAETYGYDTY
jgi:hypothetical protein